MGGFGSGRWQYGKNTTDDYPKLDIRQLQRNGLLKPGRTCSWKWKHNDDWNEKDFFIFLDWTPCNFGGKRAWFICSHPGCWRRVAILYGGRIFACRHCYKLAYPCQRETTIDRAARRANRIRKKLGWKEGILNPIDEKPKGMHWKTFERLSHQHNVYCGTSLDGMLSQLRMRD